MNIIIALLLFCVFGFVIGYMFGISNTRNIKTVVNNDSRCGLTNEELERMHIWDIVRYKHNGEYDCVWSSMHTKRDAEKRCKKLNEDYHKYYGKYVVERNGNI